MCIVALMTMVSCYEDKGNYEYIELEEVRIDTAGTGMQSEYAIMRYDTLRIKPNIYFEGKLVNEPEDAPLDYMWTIYSATTGVGTNREIDTIGYRPMLDTVITRLGGNINEYISTPVRRSSLSGGRRCRGAIFNPRRHRRRARMGYHPP